MTAFTPGVCTSTRDARPTGRRPKALRTARTEWKKRARRPRTAPGPRSHDAEVEQLGEQFLSELGVLSISRASGSHLGFATRHAVAQQDLVLGEAGSGRQRRCAPRMELLDRTGSIPAHGGRCGREDGSWNRFLSRPHLAHDVIIDHGTLSGPARGGLRRRPRPRRAVLTANRPASRRAPAARRSKGQGAGTGSAQRPPVFRAGSTPSCGRDCHGQAAIPSATYRGRLRGAGGRKGQEIDLSSSSTRTAASGPGAEPPRAIRSEYDRIRGGARRRAAVVIFLDEYSAPP